MEEWRQGWPNHAARIAKQSSNRVYNWPRRYVSTTTVMASKEFPEKNPGLQTNLDEATKGYFLQQTARFRVSQMNWSLCFRHGSYCADLSVYYVYVQMFRVKDPKVSLDFYSRIMGMSWGTETYLYFKGYHNENSDPRGFGNATALEMWSVPFMELRLNALMPNPISGRINIGWHACRTHGHHH